MVTHSCSSIFHFRVKSRSHPELCGRSSWISQHMTCFSHLLSCWTRPWRCRHVQPPPFHVDATIPDDLDLDGDSSASKHIKHQEIWKFNGNGDANGHDELWQEATGGLGEACAINLFLFGFLDGVYQSYMIDTMSGWWFGSFFFHIYIYIGNSNPNWLYRIFHGG